MTGYVGDVYVCLFVHTTYDCGHSFNLNICTTIQYPYLAAYVLETETHTHTQSKRSRELNHRLALEGFRRANAAHFHGDN